MIEDQPVVYDRHRSRFASRARRLGARQLSGLRLESVVLQICDAVVTVCAVLMDPEDKRPWFERLESCFADIDHDEVTAGLQGIADGTTEEAVEDWLRRVKRGDYTAYARRLLGAAEFDLLEKALREDAAVVALAMRRGVRLCIPFVVAWEDALLVMTPEKLASVTPLDLLGLNATKLIVDLDRVLVEKVLPALPMEITSAIPRDLEVDLGDLAELLQRIRIVVSEQSRHRLSATNAALVRKIAGAKDALEHSADGVSQAANSLIELIDRLMREAHTKEAVLAWLDANLPSDSELTYTTDCGQRRPTKRGEALCLLYGSGMVAHPPTKDDEGQRPSFIHEVLARVIVSAREELQGLKHADGQPQDRQRLCNIMGSLEGALMRGLSFGLGGQQGHVVADAPTTLRSA